VTVTTHIMTGLNKLLVRILRGKKTTTQKLDNVHYSIKSAIFASFAHVITGPKPCGNIVMRSCYCYALYIQGPVNKQTIDDLACLPESCALVILNLLIQGPQSHNGDNCSLYFF
jgi:hypothetical protein